MTGRDRIVVIGISVLLVLGLTWMLVVSPERKQAAKLNEQVGAESAQLATANSELASSRNAQAQYAAAYASIVSLGKAVPPSQEVPALIYQLAQATHEKNVEFASITSGASNGSSSSGSGSAAPAAAITGFTPMPFTFVFNGSFTDLYQLFRQLDSSTVLTSSGGLVVSGRLLTIQSIKLGPVGSTGAGQTSGTTQSEQLSGAIAATAYVLPASQGLTAGATTSAPAGVPGSASPAGAASSSPTAPAIARVTP
jgi:Type II secretion system (T2SS), protein M